MAQVRYTTWDTALAVLEKTAIQVKSGSKEDGEGATEFKVDATAVYQADYGNKPSRTKELRSSEIKQTQDVIFPEGTIRACAYIDAITIVKDVDTGMEQVLTLSLKYGLRQANNTNVFPNTFPTEENIFFQYQRERQRFVSPNWEEYWIVEMSTVHYSGGSIFTPSRWYYSFTIPFSLNIDINTNLPLFKSKSDATTYLNGGTVTPILPSETTKQYYIESLCYESPDGTKSNGVKKHWHRQEFTVPTRVLMKRYYVDDINLPNNMEWAYNENVLVSGVEKIIDYDAQGNITRDSELLLYEDYNGFTNPFHTGENLRTFGGRGYFGAVVTNIPLVGGKEDPFPDELPDDVPTPPLPPDPETENPQPDVQLPLSQVYQFTFEQMKALASLLYSDDQVTADEILDGLKMYGEKPIDFMINAYYLPFNPSQFIETTATSVIPFGSYRAQLNANRITKNSSLPTLCETIVGGVYNDYRDYECGYYIYLPYCGVMALPTEKYVNRLLTIKASFDIRTGSIKYYLYSNSKMIEFYEGQIGVAMPIMASDTGGKSRAIVNTGINVLGASVGLATGGDVSSYVNSLVNGANELTTAPQKTLFGNQSPNTAIFDPLYPYLIVETPEYVKPPKLYSQYNLPDNAVDTIGSRSGYIVCGSAELKTSATDSEIAEINAILNSGIYL